MYYSTAKEMEKLDELAVRHGLAIRQMMELAGWHMLWVFNKLNISTDKKVAVVCGKGNKGGDGLCAARHLANSGYRVSIVLMSGELKPDPEHHFNLLQKMGLDTVVFAEDEEKANKKIQESDVIVDALLGYHLEGNPRGDFASVIDIINNAGKTIISYDLPSGVDASTGECLEPCIQANATLTLAMPKKLFQIDEGKEKSGKIFLGDIGIPGFLYDQIKKGSRPEFGKDGVVNL